MKTKEQRHRNSSLFPAHNLPALSWGSASQSSVVQGTSFCAWLLPTVGGISLRIHTVFSLVPELSEGPGMCLLAGERQASGFQSLFNPWVLTHPIHHQAGSSAHGSDVRGRELASTGPAITPAFLPMWQPGRADTEEETSPKPLPLESQPFASLRITASAGKGPRKTGKGDPEPRESRALQHNLLFTLQQ